MRLKLTLKLLDPLRNILPVNYQFELGAWIYKLLNNKDSELHNYLVTTGYVLKDESFKKFVFSNLMVQDRKIVGDRLTIQSERVGLIFSTIPDRYDFLNHFLSAGRDVYWRRFMVRRLRFFQTHRLLYSAFACSATFTSTSSWNAFSHVDVLG